MLCSSTANRASASVSTLFSDPWESRKPPRVAIDSWWKWEQSQDEDRRRVKKECEVEEVALALIRSVLMVTIV